MLKFIVGRIQKGLSLLAPKRTPLSNYFGEDHATCMVPEDVGEGYFAVLAIKGGETKRFVVGLDYLTDPAFLELLDQAEQEFGFRQKGALAVPCRPQELQSILDGHNAKSKEW
ncbi:hypothetical protein RJT34_22528 [Clitoria ternatea]|uniref:Uncharacterized protein n=1 Tax=Clitoria ternatea TaxID=43366 RepID=A0AAN9FJG6_CLITE